MSGVSVSHSKEAYKCKVLSGSPQLNVIMTVAAVFGLYEQKGGRCYVSPNLECQHVGAVAVVL